MDWLIWVIIIVLIVAIVWWLLSRNSAKSSSGGMAPSSPSQTASSPQMDVTAAALTGSAPLVAAAATAEQVSAESPAAEPEPEPAPEPGGGDVDDWEHPVPPLESRMETSGESPTTATVAEEPVVDQPTLSEPVLSEGVVEEPASSEAGVSGGAGQELPEPDLEEGVTADDVTAADVGPSGPPVASVPVPSSTEPATPEQRADSAEWEATWSEGGAPAAPAPVHHREYTDTHAPTLPGAESAAAETGESAPDAVPGDTATLGGHLAADQPYGEGSASAGADGRGPDGYTVKGNADTMTYHDEDSPGYDEVQAGVWFVSSAHAEAAGFRPPRRNRR